MGDGKDVVTIGQSNACLRYIGNISGTYPKGFVQRALVDEVLDSVEDMTTSVGKAAFAKDEAAIKDMTAKDGTFAYWLGKFEARLEENEKRGNKNGFFVGDSITIAELKFKSFAEVFKKNMADSSANKKTEYKYAGKCVV